jgi:tetratricopeptide (TPR) repeat protein
MTTAPVIPAPDPRSMESALAAIGGGAAHYAADEALFQAQDLMYEAFEAQGARRVALARDALAISPDCADAYLLLAEETASSVEEARELLEQGVAAGERALGPGPFEEDVGHFWGILETRPYMRARAALAETLWTLNKREEAVEHQRELLRLNPSDNQGLRYRQAEWLLWLEHDEELDELFAAYEDDAAAAFAYTKALAALRREGESASRTTSASATTAKPPTTPQARPRCGRASPARSPGSTPDHPRPLGDTSASPRRSSALRRSASSASIVLNVALKKGLGASGAGSNTAQLTISSPSRER